MNYVEIDGKPYDVIVSSIQRSPEIRQSENAGATLAEGAEETLDPLGTFITYIVGFTRKQGKEIEFDNLWETLIKPRYDGVWVNIVYNQTKLKYKARFEISPQAVDKIDKRTGKVYWGEISVNIVPTKAQVLPE
jgi:hypothetical protein